MTDQISINKKIQLVTTIVKSEYHDIPFFGTGFFYDSTDGERCEKIKCEGIVENKQWLVTNRHIVLPEGKCDGKRIEEVIPDKIEFFIRSRSKQSNRSEWKGSIPICKENFDKRVKVHSNSEIDVAVIAVGDILERIYINHPDVEFHKPFFLTNKQTIRDKNIEVGSETLTIGYPKRDSDELLINPIVKFGIISVADELNFEDLSYFLIDTKLFAGFSGSPVISKPKDYEIRDGQVIKYEEKQFHLLGVYSGEPLIINKVKSCQSDDIKADQADITDKTDNINLGVVWYGYLINQIINSGVRINKLNRKN